MRTRLWKIAALVGILAVVVFEAAMIWDGHRLLKEHLGEDEGHGMNVHETGKPFITNICTRTMMKGSMFTNFTCTGFYLVSHPRPFMVISNRPHINLGGSKVVRVTDAEWSMLTNKYRENVTTNSLEFYEQ